MSRITVLCLVLTLTLAFLVSCSGGSDNVIVPPANERVQVAETPGNTSLLGFWQVVIDTQNGTIDAVDMRTSDFIINVLGFMEPPPLSSMSIDFGTLLIADPTISVDVIFKHPIPDPVFKGFDVRGIVFGAGLNNADGYTDVCNPEFFAGVPFGYQDGLLGAPDSVANYSGIAGYKYFADGIGLNDDITTFFSVEGNLDDRGVFSEAPATHSRHYELDWTDSTQLFFTFNYAVYANYNWPVGDPGDGVSAWDISTANSAEAFACKVTELANSLFFATGLGGGGNISLQVEVWDWQGDIVDVTAESFTPGIIAKTSYDVLAGPGTTKSNLYEFYAVPATPTAVGDLDILITAVDSKTFGESWFLGLLPTGNSMYSEPIYNCFVHTATVVDCPPAVVTGITPDEALSGDAIDDAVITGTFMDGPSLAVKLKKTGEPDIVATDVIFVDANTITCDLALAFAAGGMWDVEATNGCGTPGTGIGLFEIFGTKDIDVTYSGVAAVDIACDPISGDVLILYPNGVARRYTLSSHYTSYTQYSVASPGYRMDTNSSGYFEIAWNAGFTMNMRFYNTTGGQVYGTSHGFGGGLAIYEKEVVGYPATGSRAGALGSFIHWDLDNYGYRYVYGHVRYSTTSPGTAFTSAFYPSSYDNTNAMTTSTVNGARMVGGEVDRDGDSWWWCETGECSVARYGSTAFSYNGAYFGQLGVPGDTDDRLYKPLDVTNDTDNVYYVLDVLSDSSYSIKVFSVSGTTTTARTQFGGPYMGYTPLRIDGNYYNNSVAVLQTDGTNSYISVFLAAETPDS